MVGFVFDCKSSQTYSQSVKQLTVYGGMGEADYYKTNSSRCFCQSERDKLKKLLNGFLCGFPQWTGRFMKKVWVYNCVNWVKYDKDVGKNHEDWELYWCAPRKPIKLYPY